MASIDLSLFNNHGAYDGILSWIKNSEKPLSDAKQEGFEYTREFEYAKVYLNIETKLAKTQWGD